MTTVLVLCLLYLFSMFLPTLSIIRANVVLVISYGKVELSTLVKHNFVMFRILNVDGSSKISRLHCLFSRKPFPSLSEFVQFRYRVKKLVSIHDKRFSQIYRKSFI